MKINNLPNIDAAIELEYALSVLYQYFSERFPEDKSFWMQLHLEEIKHASLLKTIKDIAVIEKMPKGIVMESVEEYRKTISRIEACMNEECITDLNAAFEFAYSVEKTSGEIHFQRALTKQDPDEITKIFIRLNGMDLNHASRILEHWKATVMEQ